MSWKSISSTEDRGLIASTQLNMLSGLQQDRTSSRCYHYIQFQVKSLELVAITQECLYLQKGIRKGKSQDEGESKFAESLLGKDLTSPSCLLVLLL